MSEPMALLQCQGPVARITLNRPDKRNAISRQLIAELRQTVEVVFANPSMRCLLLTGQGTAFCAGMDLEELQATLNADADQREQVHRDTLALAQLYDCIDRAPIPTVAVLNGAAVAGGAGLMTVCDFAIAVESAKIDYPEVRRGLVAAIVMPYLLRHVGYRAANYLLLTGELISATEAARIGLINQAVPAEALWPTVHRWTEALLESGPQALAQTKSLLQQLTYRSISIEEAADASAAPRFGAECRQGLQAFFEKRPVPWKVESPVGE